MTRDVGNVSRADIPALPPATDSTDTLVEAQGMVKTANGELLLTAEAPTATPHQSGVSPQFCSPVSDRNWQLALNIPTSLTYSFTISEKILEMGR